MNNDALSECWTNLVDEADPSFVSGLDPTVPWPPCQEKFGWGSWVSWGGWVGWCRRTENNRPAPHEHRGTRADPQTADSSFSSFALPSHNWRGKNQNHLPERIMKLNET